MSSRLIGIQRRIAGGQGGYGTTEMIVWASVFAVGSYIFFIVWDWIGDTVDRRVDRAKERRIGRSVDASEKVVDRDAEGSYTVTFRTG